MVLSQWFIEELTYGNVHSGNVYKCIPNKRHVGASEADWLYRCWTWIFDLVEEPGKYPKYFMVDTYGRSPEGYPPLKIEVTDQNVDEFEFLFNRNDIVKIHSKERNHYDEYYTIGESDYGWQSPNYYVDKGTKKNPENIAKIFDNQIENLEEQIKELEDRKEAGLSWYISFLVR